jgi:hypothetical protein
MALPPRDTRGRFTSGGGESVGGIEATVSIDTQAFDPAIERMVMGLERIEGELRQTATVAATATTSVNASMAGVGRSANMAGYQLQILGQGLDDLQYVGEMGLRPIINNLMQMSPQLGIAAIGFDLLWKHASKFIEMGEKTTGVAAQMAELAKVTEKTAAEQKKLNDYKKEGQQIEAMMGGQSAKERADTGAVQKAFDEIDAEAVVKGIIALRLADKGEAAVDIQAQIAAKEAARQVAERVARGGGTDEEMVKYGAGGPAAAARRLQLEIDALEARKRLAAQQDMLAARKDPTALIADIRRRPDLFPAGAAEEMEGASPARRAGLASEAAAAKQKKVMDDVDEANRKRQMAEAEAADWIFDATKKAADAAAKNSQKIDAQTDRVMIDREKRINEGVRDNVRGFLKRDEADIKDEEERARRMERGADLDWRLMQLMNPEKQGQSMGIAAYEASFKAQTGLSEEAKRLHAINEVLEDIRDNNRNIKLIGIARPN